MTTNEYNNKLKEAINSSFLNTIWFNKGIFTLQNNIINKYLNKNNMKNYIKRMIEEHSELIVRTTALNEYVYSKESDKDNKVEFANKCIQLGAMKKYEEALRARLENAGIEFDGGNYFEKVASIKIDVPAETEHGSDYDIDKENLKDAE